ncbi:MAG: rbsC [Pseudonocardiales bacterium]|nr:rbsC [Pseudonocardiales bacterium]
MSQEYTKISDTGAPMEEIGTPGPDSGRSGPALLHGALGNTYGRIKGFSGALIALVIMCVYLTATQQFFLTKGNILNVLAGNSSLMLVSLGLTFVVLTAGFDLSVGAILAASGYVAYRTVNAGLSPFLAVIFAMLSGLFLGGALNGLLIGKIRLNFFVVTLGTTSLFGGLLSVITNGQTHTINEPVNGLLYYIGNGELWSIPFPIILSVIFLIISGYVLRFTSYGRAVYAVGGNPEAARLAGINVTAVLVSVYALVGLFAATAGLIDASRLASASPTAGAPMALTAGAAVLLGGTSFFGGIGGVAGTVVGVLLISVLQNGLGLIGVSAFWQNVVTGAVLIAAVILDKLQSRTA